MPRKFQRRRYENAALVAVRKTRQLILFWARRCRKSTTLGSIAFDEMSGTEGRTVIAASASLLLGKELVGMTMGAAEQAAIVMNEALAMRDVFADGASDGKLNFKVADGRKDKVYEGMSAEDFAELYQSSSMEMRLYFTDTSYSRLKIIAPNPATARSWGGTVLRDEAGYTTPGLEKDLQIATKPITDTDPTFKIIYASNLPPNDRHPFFEMTMPPAEADFKPNGEGHFYRGQNGIMVHRVALADAYQAGHVLYDDRGQPLTLAQFRAAPGNKLGLNISYDLMHESGGTAAIDLMALLTSQQRGSSQCQFIFVDSDEDSLRAMNFLRALLGDGPVGLGLDTASTTKETSNPSSLTFTELNGTERKQRLVLVFKTKKRQYVVDLIRQGLAIVRARPKGGPGRRLCIDASNERLAAEEIKDDLVAEIPVELVINSMAVHPPGYEEPTNFKTYLGDIYSTAVNENKYALPAGEYIKTDQRMVMKDQGRYMCEPDGDGKHGDTFSSGQLAEWALFNSAGAFTAMAGVFVGGREGGTMRPRVPVLKPRM